LGNEEKYIYLNSCHFSVFTDGKLQPTERLIYDFTYDYISS